MWCYTITCLAEIFVFPFIATPHRNSNSVRATAYLLPADSVPSEHLLDANWRPPAPAAIRLLLVGRAVHDAGIYQKEARALVGEVDSKDVRMVVPWSAPLSVAPMYGVSCSRL